MILECPNCSSKFNLDSTALGAEGKKVRCTSCEYTWFQAAENPTPPVDEAKPETNAKADGTPDAKADVEFKPRRKRPTKEEPKKKKLPISVGIAASILVFLLVAKGTVVSLWEPAALLYETIGMDAPVLGQNLAFLDVQVEETEKEGQRFLKISGNIVNNVSQPLEIPPLKAQVRDASQNILQEWQFTANSKRIIPDEFQIFTTEVAAEFDAASSVIITFANP